MSIITCFGVTYTINPGANLCGANLHGADLYGALIGDSTGVAKEQDDEPEPDTDNDAGVVRS